MIAFERHQYEVLIPGIFFLNICLEPRYEFFSKMVKIVRLSMFKHFYLFIIKTLAIYNTDNSK